VRPPQIRARLEIRRLLANLRAWLEFALREIPSHGPPQTRATLENPAHFHTDRCPRCGHPNRLEIRRLLANLRAWLEFAPSRNPDAFASPPFFILPGEASPHSPTVTALPFDEILGVSAVNQP